MGAEQSTVQGIVKSKNFTILSYKENDIYGSFKCIESQGQQYAMVSKTCQSYEDYCVLRDTLNQAKKLNEIPHLIKLIEVDTQEENNLCSTFYKVTALYEYYDTTLREIAKQTQINCLYVLRSLIDTLQYFHQNDIIHGNLTPDFILIDKQNGDIKVNNCTQLTGYNHYKRLMAHDGLWYLPPELVTALGKKDLKPQFDVEKSEVYQLALIALEFWGQTNIQSIYNKSNYTIDQDILFQAIDDFGVSNGYVLKNVLKQMLSLNPNDRPTLLDLKTSLQSLNSTPVEQQQQQQQQSVTVEEPISYKEEDVVHEVVIYKESFQEQQDCQQVEEQQQDYIQQPEFEESPKKVEKLELNSFQQSIKDYYVTGSIAAQFGQLLECHANNEYQSVGTAQFSDRQDILQEKSINQQSVPTSPKAQDVTKPKKVVQAPKKPVSIKRPKHETCETKLPKQAVVVSKRR